MLFYSELFIGNFITCLFWPFILIVFLKWIHYLSFQDGSFSFYLSYDLVLQQMRQLYFVFSIVVSYWDKWKGSQWSLKPIGYHDQLSQSKSGSLYLVSIGFSKSLSLLPSCHHLVTTLGVLLQLWSNNKAMMSEVTTPESNLNYDIDISAIQKERAQNTNPNGGHCLVHNQATTVDCSHCLSRCQMKNDDIVCVL